MLGGGGACNSAPTRQTEVGQAMEELSKINSILLEKVERLGMRLNAIRTPKPTPPSVSDDKKIAQAPCELAQAIRQRAGEVAQAVNQVNILIDEIEL